MADEELQVEEGGKKKGYVNRSGEAFVSKVQKIATKTQTNLVSACPQLGF